VSRDGGPAARSEPSVAAARTASDRGHESEPDVDRDPDRACARDWRPVESPACPREPKREQDVVRVSTATPAGSAERDAQPSQSSGDDSAACGADLTSPHGGVGECRYSASGGGGDTETERERGRHG
jgi:hypothetical protein